MYKTYTICGKTYNAVKVASCSGKQVAFFTPEILKVLKEKFNIGTITSVDEDLVTLGC